MTLQQILALILTLTAVAGYLNHRYIRLPPAIGITVVTVCFSATLIIVSKFSIAPELQGRIMVMMDSIDFSQAILDGMLSFLLFAAALRINIFDLARYRWLVFLLATVSVIISTFTIGTLCWWLFNSVLGVALGYEFCLVFGALISPTDPLAVISIMKSLNVPKSLEMKIAGESLFNDGMGIVMFLLTLGIASGETEFTGFNNIALSFLREVGGGIVTGLLLGLFVAHFLRQIASFELACLLTLALVTGGYTLSGTVLHVSAPIAMVTAGLIIGHTLRSGHLSEAMIYPLDTFWGLVDEVLNNVLFVLIGLEILGIPFTQPALIIAFAAIPIALTGRFISVLIPVVMLKRFRKLNLRTVSLMTWGGLRGGISIALALTIPHGDERSIILTITYAVVIFSIVVQGLTIRPLLRKVLVNN